MKMKRGSFVKSLLGIPVLAILPKAVADQPIDVTDPEALRDVDHQVLKALKGTLLVFTVGDKDTPATKGDLMRVAETVNELFEETEVMALVVPHLVKVEQFSIPELMEKISKGDLTSSDDGVS